MLCELGIAVLKKAMAVFVTATTILGTTLTPAFASSYRDTSTPIQHIVIIFQENVSFDHYFATYPYALNPPGEPFFHADSRTPSCQRPHHGDANQQSQPESS